LAVAYPEGDLKMENKTVFRNTAVIPISHTVIEDKNPAPGVCLPIIVTFCQQHKVIIASARDIRKKITNIKYLNSRELFAKKRKNPQCLCFSFVWLL